VTPIGVIPASERQARKLARADEPSEVWAEIVEEVVPIGTTPTTESQARELARSDAPAEVWAEIATAPTADAGTFG
jgi:hypothetical protein